MSGETHLDTLLRSMQPEQQPGAFVFCTLPPDASVPANLKPIGQFWEAEGLTLILARSQADAANLPYGTVFAMITLTVHSSLDAVGFLAKITAELAAHQISVNAISAYYHDHLFVPWERAPDALETLTAIAQNNPPKQSPKHRPTPIATPLVPASQASPSPSDRSIATAPGHSQ